MRVPNIICVDFDQTIADNAWPDTGVPKKGVKEALTELRRMGYLIMVYSCRTCAWYPEIFLSPGEKPGMDRKCVTDMIFFLHYYEIPYDYIDDGSKGKPMADYYIDDKAIRFENNWAEIVQFVKRTSNDQP